MLDAPGRSDLGWKLDDVLVAGWLGGGVVGRRSEFGQSLGCRHHRRPRSSRDLCAQRLGCCLSASRSLVLVSGLDCVVLCWSSVWGGAVGVGSEFEGQSLGHRQVTHSRGWCAQRLCCCLRALVACDIHGLGWKVMLCWSPRRVGGGVRVGRSWVRVLHTSSCWSSRDCRAPRLDRCVCACRP